MQEAVVVVFVAVRAMIVDVLIIVGQREAGKKIVFDEA